MCYYNTQYSIFNIKLEMFFYYYFFFLLEVPSQNISPLSQLYYILMTFFFFFKLMQCNCVVGFYYNMLFTHSNSFEL